MWKQTVILRHKPDPTLAWWNKNPGLLIEPGLLAETNPSALRTVQAGQTPHDSGLSRTGSAEQHGGADPFGLKRLDRDGRAAFKSASKAGLKLLAHRLPRLSKNSL